MKENCSFQSLFFISLPDLRKLCGATVVLNCDDDDAKSLQTITCRELLFCYPDVLAAPGEHKEIIVIMPISFYKIGNIQVFVQKHGGKMDVPQRVIPAVLQICLSFTLVARLAPDWNKAGHLLIHGKNFLGKEEKQNAVVLELNVSETQLCVSVEASTIRLTLAKVEDFNISTGVLKNFCSKRIAVLPKHFIGSNWCYVLPSMKKGQIVSISHEIPPYCPFQSYGDFQKHWKNMYGYNLPEINNDSALYYTVYFKLIGEKLFTYPTCCIRSEPVQFFPRVDLESVLTSFFSDFKKTFPSLCGSPIKITNKPYYTTNELNVSQTVQSRPPNLTTKPVFSTALTQVPAVKIATNKTTSNYSIDGNQKSTILDNKQKIDSTASLEGEPIDAARLHGSIFRSMEKPGLVFQNPQRQPIQAARLSTIHQMEMQSGSINRAYRFIPIFKRKLLKQDKEFITSRINENKTKQNESSRKLLTLSSSNANIKVKIPKNVQEQEYRNEEEDLFEEVQKQKSSMYTSEGKPNTNHIQNSYSDTVKNMCKDTLLKSNVRILKPGATELGHFQEKSMRNTQFGDKNAIGLTTFDGMCTKWIDNPMEHQHKQVLDMFDIRKQFNQEKQTHFQDLSSKSLSGRILSDKGTEKRKYEEKATDSKPKKPKAKPVIQDVDVEKHAKNNQLSKLNTVTLHSWLKCRGVCVRTRDKKEQLVSKIMEFIKGPQNEFGNICSVDALHKVQ
ncbi:uncharacterized protein C18orf63 homolog [Rhinoraja longicauda]